MIQPLAHRPRFAQEIGATLHLAAPIALAFVAQLGMGVTDTIMLGALGRDALAAGGLGSGLFFFSASVLQGLMSAVAILIAHARGADDTPRIIPILRAGYAVALLLAMPLMAVLWNARALMLMIGEPVPLATMVGPYVRILLCAAPAFMWLAGQRAFLSAMARPRLILLISLTGLVANGFLNYALIHGAWGFPAFGYLGAALASTITIYGQVLAMSLGMRLMGGLPRANLTGPIAWRIAGELLALGWPIGITIGVEAGLFFAGALLMGLIDTVALAAHQVTIQVAALLFMVPMAIGQAANVRVGYHAGAGAPHAARQAGHAALLIAAIFAMCTGTILVSAPRAIVMLFGLDPDRPADAEVIALAVRLLVICAGFQLVDGLQSVAAGALRGLKDTRVPMIAATLSYWAVGFPAAWGLGLPLGYGGVGVWYGLALSLFVAAAALIWRFEVVSSERHAPLNLEMAARLAFL